jgi:hypothetical protein
MKTLSGPAAVPGAADLCGPILVEGAAGGRGRV